MTMSGFPWLKTGREIPGFIFPRQKTAREIPGFILPPSQGWWTGGGSSLGEQGL